VLREKSGILQRIFERVTRSPEGCWLWGGSVSGGRRKYGVISYNGRMRNVRRLLYTLLRKEPGRYRLESSCNTETCINPDHLIETKLKKGGRKCKP
jgi:hypothetical protein